MLLPMLEHTVPDPIFFYVLTTHNDQKPLVSHFSQLCTRLPMLLCTVGMGVDDPLDLTQWITRLTPGPCYSSLQVCRRKLFVAKQQSRKKTTLLPILITCCGREVAKHNLLHPTVGILLQYSKCHPSRGVAQVRKATKNTT